MKNEIQRIFGLPYDKINVIPNGVKLDKFEGIERDYDLRRQYAMDNEKIILYVGRLVYEKGVQNLIGAMPKILENYHDSKLVICGRGGMMDELKQEAHNLGIDEKVYFVGYCDAAKVQKMYINADIAVFPSTYEPFGIVALEGMLSGTPTVVSDVGGLNEIVEHGVTGMKSYAGNSNSIADSVLALLYDQELCNRVSSNAIEVVKEKYNWNVIAQSTFKTYEKAISKSKSKELEAKLTQEKAGKTSRLRNTQSEISRLISSRKRNAYI